ncbi:MAG: DUF5752 family protein [archaeon]
MKRKTARRIKPAYYFFAVNGSVIRNIAELEKSFDDMSDDCFAYHVNDEKNDFHSWVRDVIGDELLAERLIKAKTKDKTHIAILRHMLNL